LDEDSDSEVEVKKNSEVTVISEPVLADAPEK
jgi:hypothetical protein